MLSSASMAGEGCVGEDATGSSEADFVAPVKPASVTSMYALDAMSLEYTNSRVSAAVVPPALGW